MPKFGAEKVGEALAVTSPYDGDTALKEENFGHRDSVLDTEVTYLERIVDTRTSDKSQEVQSTEVEFNLGKGIDLGGGNESKD